MECEDNLLQRKSSVPDSRRTLCTIVFCSLCIIKAYLLYLYQYIHFFLSIRTVTQEKLQFAQCFLIVQIIWYYFPCMSQIVNIIKSAKYCVCKAIICILAYGQLQRPLFLTKYLNKYAQNIAGFSKFSFQRKLYFRLNFWNNRSLHGLDLM